MAENPRIEELRRRVLADPASIAFAALAEEFRRVGRYADAIETCRTGLQRHPAYLSARVTLGRALIETGDYAGAREELETVLRSAPENLAAIRGLEQIHERLGHSTEMHPDLHAIAAREPIRVAAPPPPPPAPAEEMTVEPAPAAPQSAPYFDLDSLTLDTSTPPAVEPNESEPFDIFAAALNRSAEPARPPAAFEIPAAPIASAPDPHVAATLLRLERLLGAIQSARHA